MTFSRRGQGQGGDAQPPGLDRNPVLHLALSSITTQYVTFLYPQCPSQDDDDDDGGMLGLVNRYGW